VASARAESAPAWWAAACMPPALSTSPTVSIRPSSHAVAPVGWLEALRGETR
jgi:hypothetical protein